MGIVKDIVGGVGKVVGGVAEAVGIGGVADIVGGATQSRAANKAADRQVEAGEAAIEFAKESRDIAREDLSPFRETGVTALGQLEGLVTDPQKQKEFISDNPFFQALQQQTTENVLGAQAARGKLGSGGTSKALQNALVLLGSDLLGQKVGQLQNLAGLGQAAATGQAQVSQQTAQQVGETRLQQGNAASAGQIAKGDITSGLFQQGAGAIGKGISLLSDFHAKENIIKVGRLNNGLALYRFNYKGDDQDYINVMAQEVEQVMPEAIINKDGLKYVNMELICH